MGPLSKARGLAAGLVILCAPGCDPTPARDVATQQQRTFDWNNIQDLYELLDTLEAEKGRMNTVISELSDVVVDVRGVCSGAVTREVAGDAGEVVAEATARKAALETAEEAVSRRIKYLLGGGTLCLGAVGAFFSLENSAMGAEWVWVPPSVPEVAAKLADLIDLARRLEDRIREKRCECSSLIDFGAREACNDEVAELEAELTEVVQEIESTLWLLEQALANVPTNTGLQSEINETCQSSECNELGPCPYEPPQEDPPEPPEAGLCCPVCDPIADVGPCGKCAQKHSEMYFGARCTTPDGETFDLGMHELEVSGEPVLIPYHILSLHSVNEDTKPEPPWTSFAAWTRTTPGEIIDGWEYVACRFEEEPWPFDGWTTGREFSFSGNVPAWAYHNETLAITDQGDAGGCSTALGYAYQSIPSFDASTCSGSVTGSFEWPGVGTYSVEVQFQGKAEEPTEGVCESGDYTGDGLVNQADLDYVLINWGTKTSQADLDAVLGNWGAQYW